MVINDEHLNSSVDNPNNKRKTVTTSEVQISLQVQMEDMILITFPKYFENKRLLSIKIFPLSQETTLVNSSID